MKINDIITEGNASGDSSLHDWFTKSKSSDGTPGWVQIGGKYAGKPCAKQPGQKTKPKCGSSKMKRSLNSKEEEAAARRKRREDPNPNRKGKAHNVATKSSRKTNEEKKPEFMKSGNMKPFKADGKEIPGAVHSLEKALLKAKERGIKLDYYKIDKIMQTVCHHHNLTGDELHNEFVAKHHQIPDNWIVKQLDEACWKGYHKEGNKKMFGKTYPNCVKNEGMAEGAPELLKAEMPLVRQIEQNLAKHGYEKGTEEYDKVFKHMMSFHRKFGNAERINQPDIKEEKCPHCSGPMFSEMMINEKKDACYYKVKSRYSVWPSAYASGALVKCRKAGAKNWGSKSKK